MTVFSFINMHFLTLNKQHQRSLCGSHSPILQWLLLFRQTKKSCQSQDSIQKDILSTPPNLMVIFFGIYQDQEIVTQIVLIGMIGKKMILTKNVEENQKRKPLKLCVPITNLNHLIIFHHHQLLYPYITRNLDGLQKIAKLKSYPLFNNPHHPYSL